jgi:preprotein translocase subunit YajC
MFISNAFGVPTQGSYPFLSVLPFLLIFVVMYCFMIRPQQKKATAHKLMLAGLKAGDVIVTVGGIIGRIDKVNETEVKIEISKGVIISVLKGSVSGLFSNQSMPVSKPKEKSNKKNVVEKKSSKRH